MTVSGSSSYNSNVFSYIEHKNDTGSKFMEHLDKKLGKENKLHLSDKDKKALWNASVEMESIFVNQMFKAMRKNIPDTGIIKKNEAEQMFTDMLYDNYSLKVSESSSIGLAKMVYQSYMK